MPRQFDNVGSGKHVLAGPVIADFSGDFGADFESAWALPTTVSADFFIPVGSEKHVLAGPTIADYSGDFGADFGSARRGIVPIEAGTGQATTAARADPGVAMEWSSSIPADANFAVASSASMQIDASLAREFAASSQFHLLPRGEWTVAQRRENAAPAECLLNARADAVLKIEGAALLLVNPNMPTEQSSAAAALLLLAPAESGALGSSHATLPGESLSGATAFKADALLSIEALSLARGDVPIAGESGDTEVVGITLTVTLSDGRVLNYAITATPTAAIQRPPHDILGR
jgi:hypothetical protein